MRFALLSNINMDSLENHLGQLKTDTFYKCGFNQYLQELIDPASYIHTNAQDYIFFHLDGEAFLQDDFYSLSRSESDKNLELILNSIEKYIGNFADVTFIVSEIVFPSYSFTTYIQSEEDMQALQIFENELNTRLKKLSDKYSQLIILDLNRLFKLHGYNYLTDEKYWYLGRIRYSHNGFKVLAAEIGNLINAKLGKSKKVLILDLDNTLWGGIIGEDGLDGINLSEEGIGKCFRDFQKAIRSLKDLGVLLAICSKNNETDVQEVFNTHPMMILKESDFIIKKINWKNKVENIMEIANELNLGFDSFLFIDDNPVERNLIQENLNEVITPEFPTDPANIKKWFLSEIVYTYFPKLHLTEEDKQKTKQYKRNIERKNLSSSLDLKGFIESLEIHLTIFKNPLNFIPRLAQLTQKTNQFNLTTKRYSEADIKKFITSEKCNVFALGYQDKFGDEGIIGEIITVIEKNDVVIDTLLLSCRIIGRNVEYAFFMNILQYLQKFAANSVKAAFIPTKKNVLVKEFYPSCGLQQNKEGLYIGSLENIIEKLSQKLSLNVKWK